MKQDKPKNIKANHIVVLPFLAEEKRLIHSAAKARGVRRTRFYHDAIVEVAKGICSEVDVSKRDS